MSVIGVVSIGVMKANVDTKIDAVILRVPPARVHNLICIRRGIDGTIRDAIVHAIMAIIKYERTQSVRPVSSTASITNASLRRRRSRWCGRRTVLVCNITRERDHAIIEGIVWGGMIEDGLFGGRARIGRIKKRCNSLESRGSAICLCRSAMHAEEQSAKE